MKFLRILVKYLIFLIVILSLISISSHRRKTKTYSRILFLGDQITRGIKDPSGFGYRDHVQILLGQDQWKFVGSFTDPLFHPSFSVSHAGKDEDWVGMGRIRNKTLLEDFMDPQAKNDWILIHMGTVDILNKMPLEATKFDVLGLIRDITDFNPNIRIALAKIIPCRSRIYNKKIQELNNWMEEIPPFRDRERKRLKKGNNNLFLVDIYGAFTRTPNWGDKLMSTRWYPNEQGYEVMAREWVRVMKQVIAAESE